MSRIGLLSLQLLVAVVALAMWHVLTTVPLFGRILLPPFFFSNPIDVASQVVKWFTTGVIWKHLFITLWESILAFVIGSIGGVLVGFWFARKPLVAAVFDPYVKMINALPRVVLAPIFALWLGLGIWSKVALGVTLVFFIVFFNVYQGVKEVSPTVLDNGRMLGMNERQLTRHVYWPSALSWMFSSLHTAVGFAVVGAVVGEYLGSAAGLGYLIQQAEGVFDVAAVFAGMFVLSAFVILIDMVVTLVERRLLVWRPVAAEGGGSHSGKKTSFRGALERGEPSDLEEPRCAIAHLRFRFCGPGMDASRQFSIFVSSGACGGVLMAIALMVRPSAWCRHARCPSGSPRVARLHLHFLVAQPDRSGAVEDVLEFIGVGMHVLGHVAVLDRNGHAIGGHEHF